MTARPVLFGEVLFDCFPDGSRVLGGAPFNVAWHLQGFGLAPHIVSRIGDDEAGREVLDRMTAWGMDTAGIQIDLARPTGQVEVGLVDGQPSFTILDDQAYDHIDGEMALGRLGGLDAGLFYHGSLVLRSPASRSSLVALRQALDCPRCIDVNLRPPWTGLDTVAEVLRGGDWAKLNDAELEQIASHVGLEAADIEGLARAVRRHFEISDLVVTLGADGALLLNGDALHRGRPVPVEHIADTVGAGDAFSAVSLLGLLEAWAPPTTLSRALEFASLVCAQRGATIAEADVYRGCLARWQDTG